MIYNDIYSDHIYKRSENEKQDNNLFKTKTLHTSQTAHQHRTWYYTRLSHRAIQTVRKEGLQMHAGYRTWSKILSCPQCVWRQTRCNLCSYNSSKQSKKTRSTFSTCARNLERNLRHQPGISPTKGRFLSKEYGIYYHYQYRYARCCNTCCKYATGCFLFSCRYYVIDGGVQ
jgi:hypothetical protein